ncbi:RCC1 domain-containing protein [Nakamurella lactea]|uniref:RCC1 domain-containing protein n=1 Tax=Nakamurella lactea TaxID=459515 RepID=UPI0004142C88|nr:hypothetical protein [Nakamurella lactea]
MSRARSAAAPFALLIPLLLGAPAVLVTPVAAAVPAAAAVPVAAPAAAPADLANPLPELASAYVPITPCRVVDTRRSGGGGRMGRDVQRTWQVGGSCGVPTGATAVEASVSAVAPVGTGYLRVWPAGLAEPKDTVVNYAGRGITNTGPIQLSATGKVSGKNLGSATTDVVIDIQGYYAAVSGSLPASASMYVSLAQCRVVDTRSSGGPLTVGNHRTWQIGGHCGVPATATAVAASVSAVAPAGVGFLRVWPAGTAEPTATFVNYAGAGITNSGAVQLSTSGAVTALAYAHATQVVIDIQGYYLPAAESRLPSGAAFYVPVDPTRVVDTRNFYYNEDNPHVDRPIPANKVARYYLVDDQEQIREQGGGGSPIPSQAVGVAASVSAVQRLGSGFLRVWPADAGEPQATLVNYAGAGITNTAILRAGATDRVAVRNYSGTAVDVVIDVVGYYQVSQQPLSGVTAIGRTANDHACVVITGGSVKCWGANFHGQLGDDTIRSSSVPVAVTGLTGVTAVATGGSNSCALMGDTTVRCWGANTSGQLGDGSTADRGTPTPVTGLTGAIAISVGEAFACALLQDRTVDCWGANGNAQLGNGTLTGTTTPGPVSGLTDVASLSSGSGHTCALLTDGTVTCWGFNSFGQIGDGTAAPWHNAKIPQPVVGLAGVTSIGLGSYSSCAVLTDSTVSCWGRATGEDAFNTSVPHPVSGLSGAAEVTAFGVASYCARRTDGTVSCWASQQIVTPAQLPGLSSVTSISGPCAVLADHSVACWGDTGDLRGSGPYPKPTTPTLVWSGPRW